MKPNTTPHEHATPKPRRVQHEHIQQVAFLDWFELQFPGVVIFANANGGARNLITAKRLKAEGVRPGVPDLYVPAWHLWIEMKRVRGGSLSPAQKEMIEYLRDCEDAVIVAHGWEDAMRQVLELNAAKAARRGR